MGHNKQRGTTRQLLSSLPLFLLLGFAFQGCSSLQKFGHNRPDYEHRDFETPPTTIPSTFFSSSETGTPDTPSPARWWTAFNQAPLNQWVERVLHSNFDVREALARLAQANARADLSRAALSPSLNARGSLGERWREGFRAGDGLNEEASASLNLDYEIDLWQRLGAAQSAALWNITAAEEDIDAIHHLIAARTATLYITFAEQLALLDLVRNQITTSQAQAELVNLRMEAGAENAELASVLQQREQVASLEAEIPDIEATLRSTGYQLQLLADALPEDAPPVVSQLPDLPPLPATGTPADLLLNRPDLRAARARLRASDYDIEAALADELPRLNLDLDYTFNAEDISDLENNMIAGAFATITAPLLDGGRREAQTELQKQVLNQRLASFAALFRDALFDVEDALQRERHQRKLIDTLERQADLSARTIAAHKARFQGGQDRFLNMLIATENEQRTRRRILREQAELLRNRITLYQALGGAWKVR